jgi:hypothetical protein
MGQVHMKIRSMMMRCAGAGMIAVAVVPWLGGGSASAAVNVYVAAKWNGTDSATSNVSQAGCDYAEVTDIAHHSQGWHFVLPGGSGLTTFSANFQTAGKVTVTTTDSVRGVIVQGGKGAVVFTNGDDVLLNSADFANHPGQGSAATAGNNDMQLSHRCTGGPTPPVDECTNLPGDQAEVPPGYTQDENGVCTKDETTTPPPVDVCSNINGNQATIPAGYHAGPNGTCVQDATTPPPVDVCSNINGNQATIPAGYHAGPNNTCVQDQTTTAPAAVPLTATTPPPPQTSVLPTKVTHSDDTSVEAVKVPRSLPHTGGSDLLGLGSLSVGLLLLGGALLAAPNLAVERSDRRH